MWRCAVVVAFDPTAGPLSPRSTHAPALRRGAASVPNSVFEDHAGSKVRRPAQFTYLTAYNLSLKELGQLVNSTYTDSHISYCIQVGA